MAQAAAGQSGGSPSSSGGGNPGGGGGAPPWGGGQGNTNQQAYQGPSVANPPQAFPNMPPGAGRPNPATQGGGEVVDFQRMLQAMQAKHGQETGALQGALRELQGKHGQAEQTLSKLRQVFVPTENAPDPTQGKIAQYEEQLDYYLQQALEHERAGHKIPLTTNLAVQFFQSQIALETERAEWKRTMTTMQQKLDRVSNPDMRIDEQAFTSIDGHVISALDTIYGAGEEYFDQKKYQFRAVTSAIIDEIKDLKKNEPDLWDQIRRDPRRQQKMVLHFVERTIPPKARQILQDDQIRREPMAVNELWQAFREASEIQNPGERSRIRSMIRQEILSRHPGLGGQ